MPESLKDLQRRHAAAEREAREAQQLAEERAEVRRDAFGQIASTARPTDPARAAHDFVSAADETLAGYRLARFVAEPAEAQHYFSKPDGSTDLYQRAVGGESREILLAPGEEPPAGYAIAEGFDLPALRREAEQRRAYANARRSRDRSAGIPGDSLGADVGASERGVGYRRDPRTGEEVAELRPKPLSHEEDVQTTLAEIDELLADFPADVRAQVATLVEANFDDPERLSLVAAVSSVVPGPEPGSKYTWRRLMGWDPGSGYPTREQDPSVRVATLRRVMEAARDRRDAKLAFGDIAAATLKDLWR